jgi:hypothetical protein
LDTANIRLFWFLTNGITISKTFYSISYG